MSVLVKACLGQCQLLRAHETISKANKVFWGKLSTRVPCYIPDNNIVENDRVNIKQPNISQIRTGDEVLPTYLSQINVKDANTILSKKNQLQALLT